MLPDHSSIIILKDQAEEIIRIEKMSEEDLMAQEIKKLQKIYDE